MLQVFFEEDESMKRKLLAIILAALALCMPVSYTHLDVYKRQILIIMRDSESAAALVDELYQLLSRSKA